MYGKWMPAAPAMVCIGERKNLELTILIGPTQKERGDLVAQLLSIVM